MSTYYLIYTDNHKKYKIPRTKKIRSQSIRTNKIENIIITNSLCEYNEQTYILDF